MESLEKILNGMEDKIVKTVEEDLIITKQDQEADEDIKKLLLVDKDKNVINENKKDPKAKVRTKLEPVFDDKNKKVTDSKDHFPISNRNQAISALSRASAFSKPPKWYKGTLLQFKSAVKKAVHKAFPEIDIKK